MQKTSNSQLNRISVQEFKETEKSPLVVVLDNIRSQSNTGSVFRTCDAFRIGKLFLCGITATPPHREIEKTALGATQSVDWEYFEHTIDCISALKAQGYRIFTIEQAEPKMLLGDFFVEKDKKTALVFGNEINGVADQVMAVADACIEIPQFGTKHSLNVAVSAGIVLWEFSKNQFTGQNK
jgi:tRNA G18 (ribose-2'-O)-methylase SpoU